MKIPKIARDQALRWTTSPSAKDRVLLREARGLLNLSEEVAAARLTFLCKEFYEYHCRIAEKVSPKQIWDGLKAVEEATESMARAISEIPYFGAAELIYLKMLRTPSLTEDWSAAGGDELLKNKSQENYDGLLISILNLYDPTRLRALAKICRTQASGWEEKVRRGGDKNALRGEFGNETHWLFIDLSIELSKHGGKPEDAPRLAEIVYELTFRKPPPKRWAERERPAASTSKRETTV